MVGIAIQTFVATLEAKFLYGHGEFSSVVHKGFTFVKFDLNSQIFVLQAHIPEPKYTWHYPCLITSN